MDSEQLTIPGIDPVEGHPEAQFALPRKPTCTPAEAARALGISERQIRYLIEDGSLLAMSSNRDPESAERPAWRVIVRMERKAPVGRAGRTLAEECEKRMNQ
jgi:hypothetical protein